MAEFENRNEGFTLVELLVAMAIGLIVMSAVYSTYRTQQKSYILQEQVAAMQQNIRAAMYYMTREIRMAGCNPTGNAVAGITDAGPTTITFTRDIRTSDTNNTADGDTLDRNEIITYVLIDSDGDTIPDQIARNASDQNGNQSGNQTLAANIDALDFVYLAPDGTTVLNPGRTSVAAANLTNIRSVQVTVVARTGRGDLGYTNNDPFFNQQDTVNPIFTAPGDSFHRKTLTTNIRCRNL